MATGIENKLTGQIGEHLVSAKLGTRGYYASPYSGNVPGFDITAVHAETLLSFPVQVKTSTKGSLVHSTIDRWCKHSLGSDNYQNIGRIKKLKRPERIWIMVRLKPASIDGARFFICTEAQIQKLIFKRFKSWMTKHNFRRPGGGGSTQAVLDIRDLKEFEDNWVALDDALRQVRA